MAADAIIFVVLEIVPWSNPWTLLDEEYVKTRILVQGGAF